MVSPAYIGHSYDAFLFESLGVEDNGMDLSVLSALARAGVDPWAEAKRLAGLPRQAAVSAIAKFAGDVETARRLAELLPRTSAPQLPAVTNVNRERLFRKYGLLVIIAWLAIAVAFMMYDGRTRTLAPTATPAGVPITQR
jgi:hypothetical protein